MKTLRLLFALLVVMFMLQPSVSKADQVSLSSVEREVDAIATEGMRDYRIPGLAIGIVKGDRVAYLKGYGFADGEERPVTPQTPFILGSVSKSFTALAAMQLAEQGKLDLDAAVEDVLPGMKLSDKSGRKVVVRELLVQTSGISKYAGRETLVRAGDSLEQTVRELSGTAIDEPAGSKFQYSNTNYVILGEIVEHVSGLSYARYIEDNIFKPLKMEHSFADKSEAEGGGLASGYQSLFGKLVRTNPKGWASNVPMGYLISSAEDMTHYLIAQTNGGTYGTTSVVSPAGMRATHEPGEATPYGMGWFASPFMVSHGGDAENFHSEVIMFPDSGWGIVMLVNTNNSLLTEIYGNYYERLALRLLVAASDGELFFGDLQPIRTGYAEVYLDIALAILAATLGWSAYRIRNWRSALDVPFGKLIVNHAAIVLFYIAIPVAVYTRVPRAIDTPWKLLLRFVPGYAHAALAGCLLAALIGAVRMAILVYGVLSGGVHDRRQRHTSVA